MKKKLVEILSSKKWQVLILALVCCLTWSASLTREFSGYDDIKLIKNSEHIQKGVLHAIEFFPNIGSSSHNLAWTNYPSIVHRPLQWIGISLGYKIWKDNPFFYHLFFNLFFHLSNSLLIFFLLRNFFAKKLTGNNHGETNTKTFLPLIITGIWTVHPLHNESLNMISSGPGFLLSSTLALIALILNLKIENYKARVEYFFTLAVWLFFFFAYLANELSLVFPLIILVLESQKTFIKRDKKTILKNLFILCSIPVYFWHRNNVLSDFDSFQVDADFLERIFILAPQILFHYLKLLFFPINLSIDQHHLVKLSDPLSLYFLLCFIISFGLFIVTPIYLIKRKENRLKLAGLSLIIALISLTPILNIIPIYCLARERYTYVFSLAIITALLLLIYNKIKLRQVQLCILLVIILLSFKSYLRCQDWKNGERLWNKTISSSKDPGVRQCWRYKLYEYYIGPGTESFKANPLLQRNLLKEFEDFNLKYANEEKLKSFLELENRNSLAFKYSYIGSKSIASGLYYSARFQALQGNKEKSKTYTEIAALYDPEHFQNNIQILLSTWLEDRTRAETLLKKLEAEAKQNIFLAKTLFTALHQLKHPELYHYARTYSDKFPNNILFQRYLFQEAYKVEDYFRAYSAAKKITSKYYENPVFDEYIEKFEEIYNFD